MLLPHHVVPFLQHDDVEVRGHASNYLSGAHDPSPATADDFWRSIDRFGPAHSIPLLADLRDMPQTDAACSRALAVLRSGAPEDVEFHLLQALCRVDLPVLLARRDELLADERLLPHVRDHLRQRIELAGRSLDESWDELARHSAQVDEMYWDEFDSRIAERLVEAIARHGEPAALRALDRLRDGPRDDYMEVFCVQVLGELRYAPATDALVERLTLPEADVLNEHAVRALARVGTVDVVDRLEALYPTQEWGERLYVDDPLGRIKRPESEQALLRLLAGERELDLRGFMAMELLDLCTTDGLPVIRQMVLDEEFDPRDVDLDEKLLTVATMTGVEMPDLTGLRKRVGRRRRERERMLAAPGGIGDIAREFRDRWRRGEPPSPRAEGPEDLGAPPGAEEAGWADDRDWAPQPPQDPPAAETLRREAPRVGRNDPCPCGSGKKYKKCCLQREPA